MNELEFKTKQELIDEIHALQLRLTGVEASALRFSNVLRTLTKDFKHITAENLLPGIWVIDIDGSTIFVNNAMAGMLGYLPEEMIGMHLFNFMEAGVVSECKDYLLRRREGIEEVHDFTFSSKSGEAVYTRISTSPIYDADGEYIGAIASVVDISDIHILQQKLKSEFENAPIGIVHMDLEGNMLRVNRAFCEMMKFTTKELVGKSFLDVTYPEDKEACKRYKNKVIAGHATSKLVKRHLTKTGNVIWLEVSFLVEKDNNGVPDYIVAFIENITSEKRSESILEARLHLINFAVQNSLSELLVETANVVERLTESSLCFYHFLNEAEESVQLRSRSTRTTSEACRMSKTNSEYSLESTGVWADCVRQKQPIIHEFSDDGGDRRTYSEGHPDIFRELTVPILRNDQVVAVIGVGNKKSAYTEEDIQLVKLLADFAWDVADRKIREEQLRLNEKRFKTYFDLGLVGMAVLNIDRTWQYYNNKLCEILGYSKDELREIDWTEITHPDDIVRNKQLLNKLLQGQIDHYHLEKRYIKKDGSIVHAAVYTTCARKEDGSVDYIMAHVMDISERVKAKTELLEAKRIQDKILEGIRAGIMIIDPETKKIESINSVALAMCQAKEGDVLGKTCDLFNWKYSDGKEINSCPALTGELSDAQLRISCMNGKTMPILKTVIKTEIQGKAKLLEIVFDDSERKELERRLNLSQKMEAIGNLSSGIAHEINTPVQYMGDNLKFLMQAFASVSEFILFIREVCSNTESLRCSDLTNKFDNADLDYLLKEIPIALEQSQDGVGRISSIVRAMKRFCHPGVDKIQCADINSALENTAAICRNEWKYYSNLVFELDSELPGLPCFLNDLSQVFLNIIVNSAHSNTSKYSALNSMGTITIRTYSNKKEVIIEIEDDGEGIPEDLLPKIFDPFFTTKEVGQGTGQGLTLCYSIVTEKHQGSIDFSSKLGEGTKCTIKLPLKNIEECNER